MALYTVPIFPTATWTFPSAFFSSSKSPFLYGVYSDRDLCEVVGVGHRTHDLLELGARPPLARDLDDTATLYIQPHGFGRHALNSSRATNTAMIASTTRFETTSGSMRTNALAMRIRHSNQFSLRPKYRIVLNVSRTILQTIGHYSRRVRTLRPSNCAFSIHTPSEPPENPT